MSLICLEIRGNGLGKNLLGEVLSRCELATDELNVTHDGKISNKDDRTRK